MPNDKRNNLKSVELDLGAAKLDRASGYLFDKHGRELELRHQSREVLKVLAQRPGRTVSRDTLVEMVWSGRAVSADSVAQCITEIRRVLEDNDKRLIETVPRKGYRLVLPALAHGPKRSRTLVAAAIF